MLALIVSFQTNVDNLIVQPRYEAPAEPLSLDSARPLLGSGQHHLLLQMR